MLYLETSQLPISHVISVRRILYWHTILTRNKEELTSQIYHAMKQSPLKGDWINLLNDDLEKVDLSLEDEELVSRFSKESFKQLIKKKMRVLLQHELECIKSGHDKVKHIVHTNLDKPQPYLTSGLFSNSQRSILFNLRSMCERNFRDNFHNLHIDNFCQLCNLHPDTQQHALTCSVILKHLKPQDIETLQQVNYEDIFGSIQDQFKITKLYQTIINTRR